MATNGKISQGQEAADRAREKTLERIESHGLSFDYLVKKLKRELNAKEKKVFNDKKNGIVYSKQLTAWQVRQKARQDAHKLRGDYPAEKQETTHRFENAMSLVTRARSEEESESTS